MYDSYKEYTVINGVIRSKQGGKLRFLSHTPSLVVLILSFRINQSCVYTSQCCHVQPDCRNDPILKQHHV